MDPRFNAVSHESLRKRQSTLGELDFCISAPNARSIHAGLPSDIAISALITLPC